MVAPGQGHGTRAYGCLNSKGPQEQQQRRRGRRIQEEKLWDNSQTKRDLACQVLSLGDWAGVVRVPKPSSEAACSL